MGARRPYNSPMTAPSAPRAKQAAAEVFATEIFQEFLIQAARRLPHTPPGHPCHFLHGHSFKVRLCLRGMPEDKSGWVMDFARLAEHFEPVRQRLDHRLLNEVAGLENPTSENLARWIWEQLRPSLPLLSRVEVHENSLQGCCYPASAR